LSPFWTNQYRNNVLISVLSVLIRPVPTNGYLLTKLLRASARTLKALGPSLIARVPGPRVRERVATPRPPHLNQTGVWCMPSWAEAMVLVYKLPRYPLILSQLTATNLNVIKYLVSKAPYRQTVNVTSLGGFLPFGDYQAEQKQNSSKIKAFVLMLGLPNL
jgi:hypothetical protein